MTTRISQLAEAGTLTGDEQTIVTQLSTSVTITAITISAQASDSSFNDSAGGFVTAGFAVGDAVNVTGFAGDTANNIYSAIVTALTAEKMTIGGSDGDVIVDDAEGESVTITKWVSRRADYGGGGGGGGASQFAPVITESETTRTLSAADAGKWIECTNAGGCAITVPPQASVAWESDTEIHGCGSLDTVTFAGGSGVTISVVAGFDKAVMAAAAWTLKRTASDAWRLIGFLVETA